MLPGETQGESPKTASVVSAAAAAEAVELQKAVLLSLSLSLSYGIEREGERASVRGRERESTKCAIPGVPLLVVVRFGTRAGKVALGRRRMRRKMISRI